jgi:isochorismate synthase
MISIKEPERGIKAPQIIGEAIYNALDAGQSFTLWKSPGVNEKHLIICQSAIEVKDYQLEEGQQGFAFAPFLPDQKKYIFPPEIHYHFLNENLVEGPSNINPENKRSADFKISNEIKFHYPLYRSTAHQSIDFISLVKNGIEEIKNGTVEKLVPSRYKEIEIQGIDLLNLFESLCTLHPDTLVSLVSSPQTGTWMGASPELLVSVTNQNKFKTIALAGTQPYTEKENLRSVAWTQKEIEEQALVCRYIINCFKKIRLREYEEHGPRTVTAGNVMHLKTEYEVDMLATNFPQLGSVMLKLLHPTSAVCGMPYEASLDFLKNQEGYDREFYSGFLGPIQIKNESHIYVNLRCMQIFIKYVRLYAGAGVTIDSIPEMEMEETEIKMQNLQKLITP